MSIVRRTYQFRCKPGITYQGYPVLAACIDVEFSFLNHGKEILRIKAEQEKDGVQCPRCNGTGQVPKVSAMDEDDAPDPDDPEDWDACLLCEGMGYLNKVPEEEGDD